MDSSPAFRQPPPRDRWLEQFERQADLTPSRTAVISGPGSMTYDELNVRSNQLASQLRSQGVGRGNFVGLGLSASLDLPIALLGIMKSGAGYLPLDPAYPAARIGRTVDAAQIRHVVTRRDLAGSFVGLKSIHLDELAPPDSQPLRARAGSNIPINSTAGSGNGKPNTPRLPRWYSIELETGDTDRTLIISSPSFDLTRKNFFAPLLTGGTLVLDDGETYDVCRISSLVRELEVTLIHCTPSAFYPLVDAAAADSYSALASLRFAVLEGGPVSMSRLRGWLEHPTCQAEIINSHGTAGAGIIRRFSSRDLDGDRSPLRGRQIQKAVVETMEMDMTPMPARSLDDTRNLSLMETRILAIWSEVLDRPIEDPSANLLDLGGNSIHLAIIHVRLMEMTSRQFSIDSLLELPTARATADFLATGKLPTAARTVPVRIRKAHAGFTKVRRPTAR